ncbi:flagellar assembly protein FliH [Bacillus wiedmannii]|uniref:flagellar assembly protein FliH n=1 Tax=Bacillus wiedmannii TaxID=1890302 RepID=UPI000BF28988|nr:flagellar assembly protein FliH [Bacillus wiedmannii]PFY95266.1 flagellar assembly protein FliH [Bacillus wiedmannii]
MKALGLNLLTDKQLNKLITEAWDKGYDQGHKVGHTRGYKEGHHKGMTTDKQGVMMTRSGLYIFDDNKCVGALDIDKSVRNEMEQLKAIRDDKGEKR